MRISAWNDDEIHFSDGSAITYEHEADCCELNWADFSVLDIFYDGEEFDDYELLMDVPNGCILRLTASAPKRLGILGRKDIYIPFYSDQNGCYTDDVDLVITGKDRLVLHGNSAFLRDDNRYGIESAMREAEQAAKDHNWHLYCDCCDKTWIFSSEIDLEKFMATHMDADPVSIFTHKGNHRHPEGSVAYRRIKSKARKRIFHYVIYWKDREPKWPDLT